MRADSSNTLQLLSSLLSQTVRREVWELSSGQPGRRQLPWDLHRVLLGRGPMVSGSQEARPVSPGMELGRDEELMRGGVPGRDRDSPTATKLPHPRDAG